MSKEEIEKARSNILRGNDIESACLIMEEVIWNGLVITGGRVNIVKIAMRQILNFIEEYKNKGYLDVVREKVQLKEKNNQLEQENKEAYWKGYIQKQNEAMEICKICKYRKKVRNLESDNYELNNRLNDYIEERNKQNEIIDEMAEYIVELIKFNNWEELREAEEIKQYFEKKVEGK